MQFKVDENLPVEVKELLATAGHDTMTIHDQKMVGKPDPFVATVCRKECRSLLTLDLDFSDIRVYHRPIFTESSSCAHERWRSLLCWL
jgi:predicted nuclease of predicted toxin-antitoxin system